VLLLAVDQQVVQAFLSDAPHIALADGIGSGCMNRRCKDLDTARFRHPSKARPKLALMITNQILRCLPKRGGFSELLRDPGIGWRSGHADVDHLS